MGNSIATTSAGVHSDAKRENHPWWIDPARSSMAGRSAAWNANNAFHVFRLTHRHDIGWRALERAAEPVPA
ncbi:hypothetical protein GCM10025793_10230 [Lysobacter lycopersici]